MSTARGRLLHGALRHRADRRLRLRHAEGVFHNSDKVSHPFRFAVVEASPSYSAANHLANMAKDKSVTLLVETTDGGANCKLTPETEGLTFLLSARCFDLETIVRYVNELSSE